MNPLALIKSTNGRFFSVSFYKRDGSLRRMNARLGVKKHLHGGTLKYNPAEKNLVTVFDAKKSDYRSIPLDRLISFSCGAEKWSRA